VFSIKTIAWLIHEVLLFCYCFKQNSKETKREGKLTRMSNVLTKSRVILSVLLFATAFAITSLSPVVGQENLQSGNGFRVSPVTSEFTIEPGRSEVLEVTVENPTGGPIVATTIINDFVASENESGDPRIILDENESAPRNSFKGLVNPIEPFTLEPLEKREVSFVVSVPEDATAGGYYGAIRFAPSGIDGDSNIALTASVGTIVLVRVPGDLREQLDIVQLSAAQGDKLKSLITGGDVSVLIRLKNSGDIHVKPFGRITVKDMFGKEVHAYELNENRSNILPDSIRRYQDDLPQQKWFGRYTIEANIGYSETGGGLITTQATFWYLPWWAIIGILVLVAAIVGGITAFVKKQQAKKAQHRSRRR
jgi:hypothetical protein